MNIFFTFFGLILFGVTLAQEHPLGNVQHLRPADVQAHQVKRVAAYIHESPVDSLDPDRIVQQGQLQSLWEFDSSGHLTCNATFYPYADKEAIQKEYTYDSLHRIIAYREWNDSAVVEREETFHHDSLGRINRWTLRRGDQKKVFSKLTTYLPNGQPSAVDILAGKKRLAGDTVFSTYYPDTSLKMQVYADRETQQTRDSVVYAYEKGDTVLSKTVYRNGSITLREYEVKRDFIHFTQSAEYIDGQAMGILTRYLNDYGLIAKEKYTHRYRDMSYTRTFTYDSRDLLIQKNVYTTGNTPVFYVYYVYEYE